MFLKHPLLADNALFGRCGPIHPVFMRDLLSMLFATTMQYRNETQHQRGARLHAAMTALAAYNPRDPVEAMLSAHCVAISAAIMECLRIAMVAEATDEIMRLHRGSATGLLRCFNTTLRTLERRQSRPLPVPVGMPEGRDWGVSEEDLLGIWQDPPEDAAPPVAEKPAAGKPAGTGLGKVPMTKPRHPLDFPWPHEPMQPVEEKRWFEMTMEERREAFGYKSPSELEAEAAANVRALEAAAEAEAARAAGIGPKDDEPAGYTFRILSTGTETPGV